MLKKKRVTHMEIIANYDVASGRNPVVNYCRFTGCYIVKNACMKSMRKLQKFIMLSL